MDEKNALEELRMMSDRLHNEECVQDIVASDLTFVADRIEREWVELPKDADGVPIHVGDVLTDGEYTFRVDELAAFGDGSWSIRNEDGNAWAACDVTHHHEPTVEDVLREFSCVLMGKREFDGDVTEAVAEYAAKLRLADDGEEEW